MAQLADHKLEAFLRGAHIFSTVIKKILEDQYLQEATDSRLTFPQFNALKMLQRRTARHVGHVAQFLGVSYPAASKIVERLHQMGYLTRQEDPQDRRASCLDITASGERLIERYEAHKKRSVRALLESLPPGQVETFGELLEQMAASLLQKAPCYQEVCMQCGAYYPDPCSLEEHCDCVYSDQEAAPLKLGELPVHAAVLRPTPEA